MKEKYSVSYHFIVARNHVSSKYTIYAYHMIVFLVGPIARPSAAANGYLARGRSVTNGCCFGLAEQALRAFRSLTQSPQQVFLKGF